MSVRFDVSCSDCLISLQKVLQNARNELPGSRTGPFLELLYSSSSTKKCDPCAHIIFEKAAEELIVPTVFSEGSCYYEFPDVSTEEERKVVTLCGSTQHALQFFRWANLELTLKGFLVFSIGCDTSSDEDLEKLQLFHVEKQQLDATHKAKILRSDIIFVLNPLLPVFEKEQFLGFRDYVGFSTGSEVAYARKHEKTIWWMNKHTCHTACTCKGEYAS